MELRGIVWCEGNRCLRRNKLRCTDVGLDEHLGRGECSETLTCRSGWTTHRCREVFSASNELAMLEVRFEQQEELDPERTKLLGGPTG